MQKSLKQIDKAVERLKRWAWKNHSAKEGLKKRVEKQGAQLQVAEKWTVKDIPDRSLLRLYITRKLEWLRSIIRL